MAIKLIENKLRLVEKKLNDILNQYKDQLTGDSTTIAQSIAQPPYNKKHDRKDRRRQNKRIFVSNKTLFAKNRKGHSKNDGNKKGDVQPINLFQIIF